MFDESTPNWMIALRAAESKKAQDIRILDLRGVASFADYFLICSGSNSKQNQAIWDEISLQIKRTTGSTPLNVEGFGPAEWILGDYGDFLVHVFSESAREYYALERLWRHAAVVNAPEHVPA